MKSFALKVWHRLNAVAGLGTERCLFYELTNPSTIAEMPAPAGLRVSSVGIEAMPLVLQIVGIEKHEIVSRLRRGDLCYLGMLDGKPAHYSWVQLAGSHPVTPAGTIEEIKTGDFWIYHCVTSQWARGRRIYPYILTCMLRDGFTAGLGRAVIYTTRNNYASQHGILRAGFAPTNTASAIRFGGHYVPAPFLRHLR